MFLIPRKRLSIRILEIAMPAIAGMSSQMVVSVVETAMVGRLPDAEVSLAAMGLGVLATWTLVSFFSSLSTGTHILVARRFGEGNDSAAGAVLNNSLLLSFFLGLLFGGLGFAYAYEFINLFSSDHRVSLVAADYIRYRSLGLPFFLLTVSYRGFFYGIGKTKIFMFSAIVSYVVNIALDYLLIFGVLGFPAMGVGGAGLAASIGMVVGYVFFVFVTFARDYRIRYRYYQHVRWSLEQIRSIVNISLPVSLQNILILFGFLIFVAITGVIGTIDQAATQVVITALFLSFMPCFGFGIATQTLVGNALGDRRPVEAHQFGVETAKLATLFTLALGALFVLAPDLILRVITTNERVIDVARPLLRIAGVAQVVYGSGIIIAHALQAAGATLYVMYLEIITHWLIFLPLAYVFGVVLEKGILGAWLALPIYVVFYTGIAWSKFLSGSWKEMRV